jgi:hypothetical protein
VESTGRKLIVLVTVLAVGVFAFAGVSLASDAGSNGRTGPEALGSQSAPSTDKNDTKGEFDQSGNPADDSPSSGNEPSSGSGDSPSPAASLPSTDKGGSAGTASKGASLPFTGFLAIPVLLLGVALLGSGVVLRRRSSPTRSV